MGFEADPWRNPHYLRLLKVGRVAPVIALMDRPFTGDLLWVPFPGPWSQRVLEMLLGRHRVARLKMARSH